MATPTFGLSTIRYKVEFDFITDSLIFTDVIGANYNTVWGFTLSSIAGLVKVTDPFGTIIYQNAGWATDDYGSPDITQAGSYELDLGNIPVDSEGNALQGTYKVEYKLYTGVSNYQQTKDILYTFNAPTVVINLSANQLASQLTSVDTTNYTVGTVTPTISRAHKIVAPEGSGWVWGSPNPAQTTTAATRIIGGGGTASTDLWTKVWTTSIITDLFYVLDVWGVEPLLEVSVRVSGLDSIDVRYDTINEDLYAAYTAFILRWTDASGLTGGGARANRVTESRLHPKVLELAAEYQKFLIARENGVSTDVPYARIVAILNSEGFFFNDDEVSVEIVPITGGGSVGDPSTFNFGVGTTSPSGGDVGDMYLQMGTTDPPAYAYLWTKQSGEWVFLVDLIGPEGAAARAAKVIYSENATYALVGTSGDNIVFEKSIDISELDVVAGDKFKFTVGLSTDNANTKVKLYHKIQNVALTALADFEITPNQAETYLMELEVIANTNAGASTYPRYTFKNTSSDDQIAGYSNVEVDIIGEDTLNYRLYQNKADATAVTNIRMNLFVVEHIPLV